MAQITNDLRLHDRSQSSYHRGNQKHLGFFFPKAASSHDEPDISSQLQSHLPAIKNRTFFRPNEITSLVLVSIGATPFINANGTQLLKKKTWLVNQENDWLTWILDMFSIENGHRNG